MEGFNVRLTDSTGKDVTHVFHEYVQAMRLHSIAPKRVSVLLALQLHALTNARRINPYKVVEEIEALEGGRVRSITKPAAPFNHPPFVGLWHKHYFAEGMKALAINLLRGLKRYELPTLKADVAKTDEAGIERYFTPADANAIAYEAVTLNYERLVSENNITGDWLIFAKHANENYYLSLGKHDRRTHEQTRKEIDAVCCVEFPFLRNLLEPVDRK